MDKKLGQHGVFWQIQTTKQDEDKKQIAQMKICDECRTANPMNAQTCHYCGALFEVTVRIPKKELGDLVEMNGKHATRIAQGDGAWKAIKSCLKDKKGKITLDKVKEIGNIYGMDDEWVRAVIAHQSFWATPLGKSAQKR